MDRTAELIIELLSNRMTISSKNKSKILTTIISIIGAALIMHYIDKALMNNTKYSIKNMVDKIADIIMQTLDDSTLNIEDKNTDPTMQIENKNTAYELSTEELTDTKDTIVQTLLDAAELYTKYRVEE